MKNKTRTIPENINVNIDGRKGVVSSCHYIKAKTKQLREFGYSTLTEDEVKVQLCKLLNNEELDVIGMFMEDEVVVP